MLRSNLLPLYLDSKVNQFLNTWTKDYNLPPQTKNEDKTTKIRYKFFMFVLKSFCRAVKSDNKRTVENRLPKLQTLQYRYLYEALVIAFRIKEKIYFLVSVFVINLKYTGSMSSSWFCVSLNTLAKAFEKVFIFASE